MQWPTPTPKWVSAGLRYVGLREVPGKKHNPTIIKWLKELRAWWSEDETPWCGTFIAECLREAGLEPPKHWYRAAAYADYGDPSPRAPVNAIPFGAICVKSRKGGNHVFLAVARSADGMTIFGLGGNQSNMVNITSFSLIEIDAIRWPDPSFPRLPLPVGSRADLHAVPLGSEA